MAKVEISQQDLILRKKKARKAKDILAKVGVEFTEQDTIRLERVKNWRMQCFNEADVACFFMADYKGDENIEFRAKEYAKLYEHFEKGIRRASEEVKLGGPAIALCTSEFFFETFRNNTGNSWKVIFGRNEFIKGLRKRTEFNISCQRKVSGKIRIDGINHCGTGFIVIDFEVFKFPFAKIVTDGKGLRFLGFIKPEINFFGFSRGRVSFREKKA